MLENLNKSKKSNVIAPKNSFNSIINFFKGLIIGIGAILPGLSGGVLSVIFGIYDPLIKFLSNPFKNFTKKILFFIPIFLGAGAGILLFSIVVKAAFGKYQAIFVCLFIGFVIGTFPSLYKEAGKEGRNFIDIVILAISAILLFVFMTYGSSFFSEVQPNLVVWFFSGALVALGFIIPGLSPSNFLIYFGLYDKMADSISKFDFAMLIPFVLGACICILLLAKLVARMLKKHYSKMFHIILGTVIGSSVAILPSTVFPAFSTTELAKMQLSFTTAFIFCAIMLIIGIIFSYLFSKLEEKYPKPELDI